MAKDFFAEHNIAFTDIDVAANMDKRAEMIDMSGQMGVPVIVIKDEATGDETITVGFNQKVIAEKLNIAA
jgi:glutaredoxin